MNARTMIVACTLVLTLLGVNLAMERFALRVDLTDNQRFTLAESTQDVLRDLDKPITLRVYFSDNIPPQYLGMKRGIDDLLAEYRRYGGRNFQIEYRDPARDEETQREALIFGVKPQLMNVVEKDRQEVSEIYLGLVMLRGDKHETIVLDPRQPTRHLEIGLTGSLVRLQQDAQPMVAWWDQSSQMDVDSGFAMARSLVGVEFGVEQRDLLTQSLSVDDYAAAVLILSHDHQMTPEVQQRVDGYLAMGGKVIAFVQQVRVQEGFLADAQETGVTPWLAQYGLSMPSRLVADAHNEYAVFESGYVSYSVPYPFWTVPVRENRGINSDELAVSNLERVIFPWASPIRVEATSDDAPLTHTIVMQSSTHSEVTPGEGPFSLAPEDVSLLLQSGSTKRHALVVRSQGMFGENAEQPGELLLVGNTYLLQDRFVREQKFRESVAFVANMLDTMTTQRSLIDIRSRPVSRRPLQAELAHGQKLQLRYANMLGVPLLFICGGAISTLLRRRRWKKIRHIYTEGR